MDVVSAEEGVYHVLIFAEVCHDAQLYLRVVGREELAAGVGDERLADFLPSSSRTGMFCRLGLLELRRPVAVTAWLKEVYAARMWLMSWGRASI